MAATAMDLEEVQADLVQQFAQRAAKLMPSEEGILPLEAPAALAALVIEATAHPLLFDFSGLLGLPALSLVCAVLNSTALSVI